MFKLTNILKIDIFKVILKKISDIFNPLLDTTI